jgi:hypothetical protein
MTLTRPVLNTYRRRTRIRSLATARRPKSRSRRSRLSARSPIRRQDGLERTLTFFDSQIGTNWRDHDPTLTNPNIDPCERCGQFLPGFAPTVPSEVFRRLADDRMLMLLDMLENAALEVDHGIPVAILKDPRFVLKAEEQNFCTRILLVTSCGRCNRGLGKMLEPYEECIVQRRYCRSLVSDLRVLSVTHHVEGC